MSERRQPTKAWVVLADEKGPIEGFELPNLVLWTGSFREEPIFYDLASGFVFQHNPPVEFSLSLFNEGPFTRYTPRPDDEDQWTPADRMAINPPTKEIEECPTDSPD